MANKTETVTVRLTPEQRQKLEQMAAAARVSESWLVQALITHSRVVSGAVFVGAATLPHTQQVEVSRE